MASCTVSGTVLDAGGSAISNVTVIFNIQTPTTTNDPAQVSTTTATNGTWSLDCGRGLSGIFTLMIRSSNTSGAVPYRFNANIPNAASATFASVVVD